MEIDFPFLPCPQDSPPRAGLVRFRNETPFSFTSSLRQGLFTCDHGRIVKTLSFSLSAVIVAFVLPLILDRFLVARQSHPFSPLLRGAVLPSSIISSMFLSFSIIELSCSPSLPPLGVPRCTFSIQTPLSPPPSGRAHSSRSDAPDSVFFFFYSLSPYAAVCLPDPSSRGNNSFPPPLHAHTQSSLWGKRPPPFDSNFPVRRPLGAIAPLSRALFSRVRNKEISPPDPRSTLTIVESNNPRPVLLPTSPAIVFRYT